MKTLEMFDVWMWQINLRLEWNQITHNQGLVHAVGLFPLCGRSYEFGNLALKEPKF